MANKTEIDEIEIKPSFSVFQRSSVLTFKQLTANHKTKNLNLKLKITGAQSQVRSCYARVLYIKAHLIVILHNCTTTIC